jgi:hypothetical protein
LSSSFKGEERVAGVSANFRSAVAVVLCLSLGGCATQLAPSYSQSIVDGLNAANTQTMTMFATVSAGVTPDTFAAARQQQYNAIIGQFSALESQVAARPMPQPPFGASKIAPEEWLKVLAAAPTKGSLDTIVSVLTKMRDQDQAHGFTKVITGCSSATLDASLVCGFQNAYTQNFDSALTYEMALQR